MKIEQLIVQHLYKKKQVSLQGIGVFKLRPDISFPSEGEKDFAVPADAFSFEYSLKAVEDDSLVDFIVTQTGKIKPLAFSDLESYVILARQFLNLGKPLLLEGVGTLQKNQKGAYVFTPGQFVNPKIDDIFKPVTERKKDEISFESENTHSNKIRNLIIALTIAATILIGACIYYFIEVKNNNNPKSIQEIPIVIDSPKIDTINQSLVNKTDSQKIATDTTNKLVVIKDSANKAGPINFKIVLKEYNTQTAVQKAYNRLTTYGHKLAIVKVDSAKFKLAMPFYKPLADTLRIKDSLQKFFGGMPYVEL